MNISLNENIVIKDYEVKGLLIDTKRASYRKVNSSGLTISKYLEKYKILDVDSLMSKLSELYQLPEEVFKDDVMDYITDMAKRGFYLIDGISQMKDLEEGENESSTSNGIWIKVTNRCNLRCRYCYANSGEGEEEEITINEIKEILEELKVRNYRKIIITGGDPLMRKDILEILEVCRKYGQVQLLTNGTIGEKNVFERIIELVDVVQISIDSYDEDFHDRNRGKGSFQKAISTIKFLTSLAPEKIVIAMTPTPEYMADIVEMIRFCLALNVKCLHINRFVPYGRAKSYQNHFDIETFYKWVDKGYDFLRTTYVNYYKQNKSFQFRLDVASDLCNQVYSKGKKISCGLNCNQISIESNGDVYLCASLHIPDLVLGNIRNEKISDILDNSQKKYGNFSVDELPGCQSCDEKYFCGGGCRAIALNETGDLYGKESSCSVYKKRIHDLMLR